MDADELTQEFRLSEAADAAKRLSEAKHDLLHAVVRCQRAGATNRAIGAAIGMSEGGVRAMLKRAE